MRHPWDVPPLPTKGDDDIEFTYAGVGRVLSQWETAELELSRIYGLLLNRPDDIEAIRLYGDPKIFEERAKGLAAAAEQYFRWNPHQDTEAELSELMLLARQFSARRNEVAHSIVRPIGNDDGPQRFCALPPQYEAKKFDSNDTPAFGYTSVELNALHAALYTELVEPAKRLSFKLALGEDGVPPTLP
jgi:hypothetical protein